MSNSEAYAIYQEDYHKIMLSNLSWDQLLHGV